MMPAASTGFLLAGALFAAAMALALLAPLRVVRGIALFATLLALASAIAGLPGGTPSMILFTSGASPITWRLDPATLWLLAPSLFTALLATWSAKERTRTWYAGYAAAAIGVFALCGLQNGATMVISWELMSLGGAMMILSHYGDRAAGKAAFSMLSLLEMGSVALLVAVVLLGPNLGFSGYANAWSKLPFAPSLLVGILFLAGFGAKLGIIPFYAWFPDAYGTADGATGALLSGFIMNGAFFALGRALLKWLPPHSPATMTIGIATVALGALSAVITALYAFQQRDWRRVLSLSSAENAGIAVTALGASLIFQAGGQPSLAGLCWIVAILHLMGHSLAKCALFLTSAAAASRQHGYRIEQSGLVHGAQATLGVGALIGAMSLSAMPPTAGFVSEWLLFEALFHDFTISSLIGRTTLILAGAALALTAAISLAKFVKLIGVGLLGRSPLVQRISIRYRSAILLAGAANAILALSLVAWAPLMQPAIWPDPASARSVTAGLLIVPLSPNFAFISPLQLTAIATALATLPLFLIFRRRSRPRQVEPWSGGEPIDHATAATTAFTFSNSLRAVYSFLYRPETHTSRFYKDRGYVLERVTFSATEAPMLGTVLLSRLERAIRRLASSVRFLQNGQLNTYLTYIGVLFVILMMATFVR